MDDSWCGKMLNCPNCRGIIDVPSKRTHDAMGAAMVPQRESPRTERAIYYALTAIFLVLILIPFFWHGFFQADSDDHSQGAADYLQDRSSELAERLEVPLAQGRASNAIYFYLQDIVRDYRDRFGDVPMRHYRATVEEMLREKSEPNVVKIVDEFVMPQLEKLGLAHDYDPKELRVHYRNNPEAPYLYLENLDPQTIDRLSVKAVDITGVDFPARSVRSEEGPVLDTSPGPSANEEPEATAVPDEISASRQQKVAKQSGGEGLARDPNSDPISKLSTAPEETPSSLDGEATAESMDHSSQPDSGDTGGGNGSNSQHPSVLFLTRDGGKITWRSSKPCATELMLRRGELPERTKGREMPWTDGKDKVTVVSVSQRPTLAHETVLTGLRPGTRYYYKVRQAETADTPGGHAVSGADERV